MSNLETLNQALFAQLERLTDSKTKGESLKSEIDRADAVVGIAKEITSVANVKVKAAGLFAHHGKTVLPHLPLIGSTEPEKATLIEGTTNGRK